MPGVVHNVAPIFIAEDKSASIRDVDGNEYVDFVADIPYLMLQGRALYATRWSMLAQY